MNPVCEDIKDILEAESGLALELATNLFIGREPPTPDLCVTLYDTGGRGPSLSFEATEQYHYHTFQARVRSRTYSDGMNLAHDLMGSLHGRGHEEWNNTTYQLIRAYTAPALIGRDELDRLIIVVNFETQRREA
jgi:hypothetical protein